jgi:hypothetical protein
LVDFFLTAADRAEQAVPKDRHTATAGIHWIDIVKAVARIEPRRSP